MVNGINGNTHSASQSTTVYSKSGASEKQTRFIDVFPELKLASREGNRLNMEITIPETPDDEPVAKERVFDGKITHWEEMGFYQAPITPELIEVIPPKPTHAESIYDIPVSEWISLCSAARDVCNDTLNTEGMTKGEIYNSVKSIFEDYLGKDFMEPFYTRSGYGGPEFDVSQVIFDGFHDSLGKYGIKYRDSNTLIEANGYTGMSNDEIKAAVREKYPEVMTLRECLVMSWELYELGVTPRNYGYAAESQITLAINTTSSKANHNGAQIYEKLLDLPADYNQIEREYKLYEQQQANYVINQNKLDPVSRYLAFFKVSDSSKYSASILNELRSLI